MKNNILLKQAFPSILGKSDYRHVVSKAAVFCGPSLSVKEAKAILPKAQFFPPVKRGDILKVLKGKFNVVGIIDGTFINQPTLSGSEIFRTLERGVHLYGSSGLGALRAVEFSGYGMQGIGTIYSWYKSGKTYRDDEVVNLEDPRTSASLTDPLVNFRFACIKAIQNKIISKPLADRMLDVYQNIYFLERTYKKLFQVLRSGKEKPATLNQILQFENYIIKNKEFLNLQKIDAIKLLDHINNTYLL